MTETASPRPHARATSAESLRYRALLDALWSLRGRDHFVRAAPTERALRYRSPRPRDRGVAPLLDVYLPRAASAEVSRAPAGASVVLVHGGGFVLGSRDMKPMRYLAARLLAERVAVCSVDYRLIFRGGRLEEALDDVRSALAFWLARAARYDLDPARVTLVGLSAGATLAMLTSVAPEARAIRALGCAFGLYELDHLRGPLAEVVPRLLFRTSDRAAWSARSPARSPQPTVPTLLLHGTADGLVPHEQSHRLAERRQALGLPTKLVIYPGAPHGFFNTPCEAGTQGASELVALALGK